VQGPVLDASCGSRDDPYPLMAMSESATPTRAWGS
jgi:hypothetical protein